MGCSWFPSLAALIGATVWYGVVSSLAPPLARPLTRWLSPLVPLGLGILSFRLLGAFMAVVHPLLEPHLHALAGSFGTLPCFILDVGIREESVKLLLALPCLLWLRAHPGRPSPLLAGALVGLGFATAENRWFFTAHTEPTLLVGRVFATTLLHTAATGICASALLRALGSGPLAWLRCAATCLLIAAAHGLYDWAPASGLSWLHLGGTSWLSQAVVLVLAAWFLRLLHTSPRQSSRASGRAAAQWLLAGAVLHYGLALGLTWARWHTAEAVWICARECALFIPIIALTAACLLPPRPHI